MIRARASLAAALIALALPGAARADEAALKDQARKDAEDGIALFDKGDFRGAAERFLRAYSLVPAPTVGLRLARAQVKLGKLIDAVRTYEQVARAEIKKDDPPVFQKAIKDAAAELAQISTRIPTLTVKLDPGVSQPTIDGRALAAGEVGAPLQIDPGSHVVAGAGAAPQTVTLAEGESRTALLRAGAASSRPGAPIDWRVPAGIAGVSAGAALAITGAVSIAQIKSAQSALDPYRAQFPASLDVCSQGSKLGTQVKDACSKGHTFMAVEVASFSTSAVFLGLGTYFLVTRVPKGASAPRALLIPSIGPRGASLAAITRF
jgi:hypothetical protein